MLCRIAACVALVVVAVPAARATSCNHEIVARITMASGASCWRYRGDATTFVGEFGADQRVSAFMKGEAAEDDPATGRFRVSIQNREPNAEGPRGFFVAGSDGALTFTTPSAGVYRFGFSPCAMWGAPGTVEICAH